MTPLTTNTPEKKETPSTSSTSSTDKKETSSSKKEDKEPAVAPVTDKDIKNAAIVETAQQAVPLNTSEDAVMAYLRDQIDEDVLRRVVSRFGKVSYHWLSKEQVKAFSKELPEDLIFDSPSEIQTNEELMEDIQDKKNEREEAMRDTLKHSDDPLEKKAIEADLEKLHPKKK
jgi:hypothetical protein